jgi:hypothetical protein
MAHEEEIRMFRRRHGLHESIRFPIALVTLFLAATAFSGRSAASGESAPPGPFASYRFLIGEWNLAPEAGGPVAGIVRFRWGPHESYIWYATSLLMHGAERPHFEGILVWNGVHKNLDMLLSMDLEHGLVQEQGTVFVEPDGTVVREITASYSEGTHPMGQPPPGPGGATGRFRQTFRAAGPDRILTQALWDSGHGWVPTFPGSDHLVLTRREPRRS